MLYKKEVAINVIPFAFMQSWHYPGSFVKNLWGYYEMVSANLRQRHMMRLWYVSARVIWLGYSPQSSKVKVNYLWVEL